MSNSINIQKILTRKIPGIQHDANVVPCVFPGFTQAKATDYWDALTVANGGTEVNGALYGITTCALKSAIDLWFSQTGALNIEIAYPYIGGTAATHAINAWNPGIRSLTFYGGVTHTAQGCVYNGTGHADVGIIPSTIFSNLNYCVSGKTLNTTSGQITGCTDAPGHADTAQFLYTGTSLRSILYRSYAPICDDSSSITTLAAANGFNITQRETATEMSVYQNGLLLAHNPTASAYCGTIPSVHTLFIGANNLVGLPSNRLTGTLAFNHFGKKIQPANINNFTTATNALMATLGR